jgi:hypothetical protein
MIVLVFSIVGEAAGSWSSKQAASAMSEPMPNGSTAIPYHEMVTVRLLAGPTPGAAALIAERPLSARRWPAPQAVPAESRPHPAGGLRHCSVITPS